MKRFAIVSMATLAILGCASDQMGVEPRARVLGASSSVGKGAASSFAEFDRNGAPRAIGVVFQASALDGLPAGHSDGTQCFDRNSDGKIDLEKECMATHAWVIPLPSDAARKPDMPFKWVGLNWNPHGHIPPGIYDLPHFDVHFYIDPIEKVLSIAPGPCGAEFVRCDQFKTATKSLPSNYMHADYKSVDAVAAGMGNHLIDLTSPEFRKQRFTRTFIFGTYDGRLTFFEEMLTHEYMLTRPNACFAIKSPPAVAVRGYYPTQSCIRYLAQSDEYTVSLEGFALREAGAPATN